MLSVIWTIFYQDVLLYFLIIGLGSFFIRDVTHCKAPKNMHVLEILLFVGSGFFCNYFNMVLVFCGKSVL